jgi:hypothetical protein
MKAIYIILIPTLITACTTSPEFKSVAAVENISIAQLRTFSFGSESSDTLKKKFGAPKQTLAVSPEEDVWVYNDSEGSRLTFGVSHQNGVLLTAALSLRSSDRLSDLPYALSYFKDSKFRITDVGLEAKHEYSDESNYRDDLTGVSMLVSKTDQTVSMIGFGMGKARTPSAQP